MPYRIILHCGLHKTGTTALQHFLTAATDGLRSAGVLVPSAGRIERFGGGHHNIAWELARDRRFDRSLGGVAELAEEIAAFSGDAIVSSEDFESCLAAPARLAPLLHHPKLQDRQFIVVLYLRDQITYAEGLFIENLGHGCGEEAALVAQQILTHGELAVREWRFQFDYDQIRRSASALAPAQLALRAYPGSGTGGIVADFMGWQFAHIALSGTPVAPPVNERWNAFQSLMMFYGNRIARRPDDRERAVIHLLAEQVATAPLLLPPNLRHAFVARFMQGNLLLCQASGLALGAFDLVAKGAATGTDAAWIDRVFAFETPVVIAGLAAMLPADTPQHITLEAAPAPVAAVVLGVAAAWRTERALL